MLIGAWCPKCGWKGQARVGKRIGLFIGDYECPNCGNSYVKRPYRGGRSSGKLAKLKGGEI